MKLSNPTPKTLLRVAAAGISLGMLAFAQAGAAATPTVRFGAGEGISQQPAAPVSLAGLKGPTNAALRHYRAWGATSSEDLKAFGECWDKERDLTPGWKPSAELQAALKALSDYANLALRATQLDTADWGIEYPDGWMALLPHLGKIREEARVLEMQARSILAGGAATTPADHARAVSMLAGLFRLSLHVRGDRTLISTLVAASIANRAGEVVTALLDQGALTKADAPVILAAARSLPAEDPFNFLACIAVERDLTAVLFNQTGPDAGKRAAEQARVLLAVNEPGAKERDDALMAKLSTQDEAGLRTDLALHAKAYADSERIMREGGDRVVEQLGAIEKRVSAGEYGVVSQFAFASLAKAYTSNHKIGESIKAVVAKLEAAK